MASEERRRIRIAALYREAQTALAREEWAVATEQLQAVLHLEPTHAEAQARLHEVRQQQELATWYATGQQHYAAGQWQAALEAFRRVQERGGNYKDVETLLATAQRELARVRDEERRRAQSAALYREAQTALASEDWAAATEQLQAVLRLEPTHAEAQDRLHEVRQQQELATWYATGQQHYAAGQWQAALEAFRRVRKRGGNYKGVDGLIVMARSKVKGEKPARAPLRSYFHLWFQESEPTDVWLGAATPPWVSPNSEFVARFLAYTAKNRRHVATVVEAETPEAKILFDLYACQWEPGTKITVALSVNELHIESSSQSFVWNGKWVVLRFDVTVPKVVQTPRVVLRFDISIEGLIVARLRPEIRITADSSSSEAVEVLAELKAPDTAFASYDSRDRQEVFGRIRSLQIFTGMDVFLDCLSIRPGEKWKDKIKSEILQRDIFWLFWFTSAKESPWVEWEWRTALTDKTINAIQPHPLEPSDIAPPPVELAALQFGTLYESFLTQSKSSWWDRRIVQMRKVTRQVASLRLLGVLLLIFFAIAVWMLAH